MNDLQRQRSEMGRLEPEVPGASLSELIRSWGFEGMSGQCATSIPLDNMVGKSVAHACLNNSYASFDVCLDKTISVEHWLVSPVQFADDETGEVRKVMMLRLILKDGTILQTTGPAAIKSLLSYDQMVRPAPWNPSAEFIVRAIGKPPRRYFQLEPVFEKKGK